MNGSNALIVFYQGMTSSFFQHMRFTNRFLPFPCKIDERKFIAYDNTSTMKDIEEVVYWKNAQFYERVILFPWFLVNYLLYLYLCNFDPHNCRVDWPIHAIRWWLINVAQNRDIEEHYQRLAYARRRARDIPKIAWGVSRGAATTFCSIASMKRHDENLKDVKLVVLEGCFDSVPSVLEARYGKTLANFAEWLLEQFTEYKRSRARAMSPLAMAHQFPKHIPVVFITSKADKTVPYHCTRRLYDALRANGHQNVQFLTLGEKGHNEYYTGKDAVVYQKLINHVIKLHSI